MAVKKTPKDDASVEDAAPAPAPAPAAQGQAAPAQGQAVPAAPFAAWLGTDAPRATWPL